MLVHIGPLRSLHFSYSFRERLPCTCGISNKDLINLQINRTSRSSMIDWPYNRYNFLNCNKIMQKRNWSILMIVLRDPLENVKIFVFSVKNKYANLRNWVFATNSNYLVFISLQSDDETFNFNHKLIDLSKVWKIKIRYLQKVMYTLKCFSICGGIFK